MKNLSAVTKLLAVLCILSGFFCGAMAVRLYLQPVGDYTAQQQTAKENLNAEREGLSQRMSAAQKAKNEALTRHEDVSGRLEQASRANEEKKAAYDALVAARNELDHLPEIILQTRTDYGNLVRQLEEKIMAGETDVRICYLTLDDGPNNLTGPMLDKLEELDAYATFFTIGSNSAPGQAENLRREMMGGHTVGNHTYSHDIFGNLYSSMEEFTYQVEQQDIKVFNATGFHTQLFRFPSGSVFCPFLEEAEAWLKENDFYWIDWNASGWDSGFHSFEVGGAAIASNVLHTTQDLDIAVVLCHDFNYSTYLGLDQFIPQMQEQGYVFLPLFPQSHMLDEPLPVV